jgi:atlastin
MSLSSLSNSFNAIELNDVVPLIGNEIGNNSITAPRSDGAYQLPILSYDDENKFIYHRDNLLTLFRRLYLKLRSLKNFKIPIAVVSMMGKSRIGKSLLANLLIRFLERNCDSDWMRAEDDLLKGFSFGGGRRVITRGILMWSEPFIIDTPKGKIVVLAMDTEGLYEVNTQENYEIMATIAMICFLISSTQIYNFKESFHSEEIKYLKTITDRFIYEFKQTRENKTKLCQNMAFIMRDWPDVISYPDPIQDGRKYLEEQTSEDFNELKETVDKLGVFLMSHPGKLIATEQLPNFQYRYNIFEPLFLSQVNGMFLPLK